MLGRRTRTQDSGFSGIRQDPGDGRAEIAKIFSLAGGNEKNISARGTTKRTPLMPCNFNAEYYS